MRADKNYVDTDKLLEAYAQGLVDHYDELLAVCCVGKSSHKRLVPGFEAPTKENNGWGWHDRTKTVRIPGAGGRVELRLADPDMNPYVALPLMLKFGYEAVKKNAV
jgi:glutamine synthetase